MSITETGATSRQCQYNSGSWGNVVNGTPAGSVYTNATTTTVTIASISAAGAYQYRCAATNACGTTYSNAATLTVNADPSITAQPANATICLGGTYSPTITTSGGVTVTYQWQYNSGSWNSVANGTPAGAVYTNATTATMTIGGITAAGSYQYRCIISDAGNGCTTPLTSNTSTFDVATTAPTSVDAGEDQYICANPATMAATGTGAWTILNGTGSFVLGAPYDNPVEQVNVTNPNTSVTFRWGQTNGCGTSTDDVVITRQ